MSDVLTRIDTAIKQNPVIIFMKGSPQFPTCGFSSRAAAALAETELEFAYINVFDDTEVYEHLPEYADWPTFPQIYIGGELVGGCDIVLELHARNELKPLMAAAIAKAG